MERALCGPLPPLVDCVLYLESIAGRQQAASNVIAAMMTSVQPLFLNAIRARALAVALVDLLHFLEAGVPRGGEMRVYLAVAFDDDRLVVGLGADGDVSVVASAGASCSMMRARAIVRLLRGEFQRGVDADGRMVFGLTFPRSIAVDGP